MKNKTKKQIKKQKRIKLRTRKLLKKYPFLAPIDWYTQTQLSVKQHKYEMGTALDDMPKGWRKAFGIQLAKDIKQELKQKHIKNYVIYQVKEKYGGLRWYDNYGLDCLRKYEDLSYRTCVNCGQPATKISLGWICPWCDTCIEKICGDFKPISEFYKEY